jgi:hypothetical protein
VESSSNLVLAIHSLLGDEHRHRAFFKSGDINYVVLNTDFTAFIFLTPPPPELRVVEVISGVLNGVTIRFGCPIAIGMIWFTLASSLYVNYC